VNYYDNNTNEVEIDENDLDELSDVSDMSEDEEEIEQRELWKANQRRVKDTERDENEDDFVSESVSRNDSIAINQINEEQSRREREKAHIEKRRKELEKIKQQEAEEKEFEEKVGNIIANLNFEESFEFSDKLSNRKKQIVHQVATKLNIFHESYGEGNRKKLKIKKHIVPESTIVENKAVDDLTSIFKKRCGLCTPSKRNKPKKYGA
jgi:chromatin segregation and condensation protein Rec8/ScpA/Scc1 (kleisin family)